MRVSVPLTLLQLLATLRMSDLHNILFSASLLSFCKLRPMASFMEPIHLIIGLPLSLPPSVFPSIIFSKEPCLCMVCSKWDRISFVIFAPSNVSALICSRTHLFIFLAAQGIHRALLHLKWIILFFLSAFFTVQLSHLYTIIWNTRAWKISDLVFNDTCLALVISNSSLLPFSVSAFPWFFACTLHLNWWLIQRKENV